MKNQFKKTLILALTGILVATAPTTPVSAASKKTKNIIKNTEKILEINTQETENTIETNDDTREDNDNVKIDDVKDNIDNTTKDNIDENKEDTTKDDIEENKEDTTKDNTKENTNNTKEDDTSKNKNDVKSDDSQKDKDTTKEIIQDTEKNNTKKEEKKVNYTTKILTITKNGFVADTLNGVQALYRPGRNDGSNSTYSCAAFIKRYYKEVHGVTVMNLFAGRTPSSSKGSFKSVSTPQVGDVVACPSTSGSNHWAIVKQVNNNNTVTLIEQNWKWSQGGQTLCKINRSISISSGKFYRLYK